MQRVIFLLLILVSSFVFPREIEGVFFPEKVDFDSTNLLLNGVGLRVKKIAFLNIKVYVSALYLEKKESNPSIILRDDTKKALIMHFIYNEISKEKLIDAFRESFEKNEPSLFKECQKDVNNFFSILADVKKDDEIKFFYTDGRLKVYFLKNDPIVFDNQKFVKLLFSVFLGSHPPNEELKRGLLGK